MLASLSDLHYSHGSLIRSVSKNLLAVTLFTISFPRSWSLYPLGLLLISGLLLWVLEYKSVQRVLRKEWVVVLPPVVFFLIHAVSVVIGDGPMKLLEDRLMFFLVPIFLYPMFTKKIPDRWNRIFIKSFIYGVTAISLFLFLRVFSKVFDLREGLSLAESMKNHGYLFHYNHLSIIEHSSYFSLKVLWAIVLTMGLRKQAGINLVSSIVLIAFLTVTVFCLGSRAGFLAWVVTMCILLVRLIIYNRFHFLIWFTIPAFLVLFLFVIVRIDKVEYFIRSTEEKLSEERIDWKNIDIRTRVWYSALQIIKEKPVTGVGLPKVKQRLKEEYIKHNFSVEAELNLNAHNQFMETQVTFGVVGTMVLLWMLFTPVIQRGNLKFPLQAKLFVLIYLINLLFESMLNRQWGIMLFMLFYCILVYQPNIRDSVSAETT